MVHRRGLQPYNLRFIGRMRIDVDELKGFERIIDAERAVAVLIFRAPADDDAAVVKDGPV
jgi:hypothetical protein